MMLTMYSGGSREGTQGALPTPLSLCWVKKEEIKEGRKAGKASKNKTGLPLSSSAGSANDLYSDQRLNKRKQVAGRSICSV